MARDEDRDWEPIRAHYCAGIRSLKSIGKEFNISDAGILKRAKRDGWVRNLSARIKAKAEAKVSAAMVSAEVSAERAQTEADIVDANATMQANIIIGHRTDVQKARALTMRLMTELEHQTLFQELYQQLGKMMERPDDHGRDKLAELYQKAMSLSSRSSTLKALVDSLKSLVGLEREAFGIDSGRTPGQTLDEFLSALKET